jgi:predicted aspartyl protease/tetratricopeptide (TPR) repeat protein
MSVSKLKTRQLWLQVGVGIQCASLFTSMSFPSSTAAIAASSSSKSATTKSQPTTTKPAREVLEQILKAFGGVEKLKEHHVHPMRTHATISSTSGISSAENSYECDILERDGKARIEMTMLGVPMIIGFDGKTSWQQYGDWVSPAGTSMTALMLDELKHGLGSLAEAVDPKSRVESVPKVSVDGKLCDGIKVTQPDGTLTTFYADPVSHLVLRADFDGTDHELAVSGLQSLEFSDYRPTGSSFEPYRVVHYTGNRKKTETLVKSIDTNVVIDDKAFQMPPESEIARLKDSPVTVPFEYSGNEILIKAKINSGPEQRFIVDTGASQSVIDKSAANAMGTRAISTFSVTSGSKAVPLGYTKLNSVTIGDITLSDIPVLITDLSGIGEKPAGLIGANILRRFLVTIDFDEKKLIFADPRKVTVAKDAIAIPTKPAFGGTAMIIKAELDEKPPINFLVDTGASFNNLPQALAKPIYGGTIMPVGTIFSIDGHPMTIGALKVKTLKLGGVKLPNAVFTVAPENNPSLNGLFTASTMGILGNPVWSQFKTTVDYRNERLILEPQAGHQKYVRLIGELEQIDNDFLKSKNDDEALKAYEKILVTAQVEQQKPIEALATARVADCYVQKFKKTRDMKWFELALSDYEKALKIANESRNRTVEGEVLAQWALALLEGQRSYNEITTAQELLKKALLKAPADANIFAAFGTTLLRVGKRAEAEKLLDRTLVLDPANWQALWAKYKLYQEDKRPKEMGLIVEQLQHYYPTYPEVLALAPNTVKPAVATAQSKASTTSATVQHGRGSQSLPSPLPGQQARKKNH